MQKWGKNRNGSIRFRCKNCGISRTRKRLDLSKKKRKRIFHEWLAGKNELSYFAKKYELTTRTLNNWFKDFWDEEIQPKNLSISNQIIIIDGYVVEEGTVLLLVKTISKVVFWTFVERETYSFWLACLSSLKEHPSVIVCDGQKGMIKAIKELFPRVIIQRCQFHILQRNRQLLTNNPETQAAIEFKKIVDEIPKILTKEKLKLWLEKYLTWRKIYDDFLKQKTYYEFDTQYIYKNFIKGKRPWFYTHKRLRGAVFQIKKALPNLFCYLNNPDIPKTTNHVEGGINSQLKLLLRPHRGLPVQKRKYLISYFLAKKQ